MEQIKKILSTPAGDELKTFLNDRLNDLRDIEKIVDLPDPVDQAIEIKSQKRAYDKLSEILEDIISISKEIPNKDLDEYYNL